MYIFLKFNNIIIITEKKNYYDYDYHYDSDYYKGRSLTFKQFMRMSMELMTRNHKQQNSSLFVWMLFVNMPQVSGPKYYSI